MNKTLETLVNRGKKVAKTTLATALLSASLATPQYTNADVVFSMEAKNDIDYPTRVLDNSRPRTLKLFVYADNTSEPEATKNLKWKINYPEGAFTFLGSVKPNPYIDNFIEGGETNDFFYSHTMDYYSNSLSLNDNARQTVDLGVKKSKGLVGLYYFQVKPNSLSGPRKFKVDSTEAYDSNGNRQLARETEMTVHFVPPEQYETLAENQLLIIDHNSPDVSLHVSKSRTKLVLESSSDLRTWTPLSTNQGPFNVNYQLWPPFDYTHKINSEITPTPQSTIPNNFSRFYRARSLPK